MCACVRVCACECVRACARACVHVCGGSGRNTNTLCKTGILTTGIRSNTLKISKNAVY